jgi:hypothetical protein
MPLEINMKVDIAMDSRTKESSTDEIINTNFEIVLDSRATVSPITEIERTQVGIDKINNTARLDIIFERTRILDESIHEIASMNVETESMNDGLDENARMNVEIKRMNNEREELADELQSEISEDFLECTKIALDELALQQSHHATSTTT